MHQHFSSYHRSPIACTPTVSNLYGLLVFAINFLEVLDLANHTQFLLDRFVSDFIVWRDGAVQ